ncbi:inhibitor of KinA sporulation pathway (predicted exonuclease) [Pseudomonas marginalis]|nr:inhibitor of KinA sporulation pathway (predicted exonuclease) [Pseudomonas marginalis]MCP1525188.1 inhibitor of KinA sporulation pathway (predicted exonuclease) [Pseudomonas marginalis]MDQ0500217.1 inhibitor of KinA sporulation pathway (predicted exonuclease) [Pseudomonas marginalis]
MNSVRFIIFRLETYVACASRWVLQPKQRSVNDLCSTIGNPANNRVDRYGLVGTRQRGIDDARNFASIVKEILA